MTAKVVKLPKFHGVAQRWRAECRDCPPGVPVNSHPTHWVGLQRRFAGSAGADASTHNSMAHPAPEPQLKLTPGKRRALQHLVTHTGTDGDYCNGYCMASTLWPDSPGWQRTGHNGVHGPFMNAKGARELWELRELEMAWRHSETWTDSTGQRHLGRDHWQASAAGRTLLALDTETV